MAESIGISEYIKIKREEKGLSQRELAKLSKVSNTEISKIELGERKKVSIKILEAIAPHLGVPYEELLKIAGYIPDEYNFVYVDDERMPEYFIEAVAFLRYSFDNLSEHEFKTMLQLAKSYYQTIMEVKNK